MEKLLSNTTTSTHTGTHIIESRELRTQALRRADAHLNLPAGGPQHVRCTYEAWAYLPRFPADLRWT